MIKEQERAELHRAIWQIAKTAPKHWDDEPFDAIVSNPPYSIRWEGDSNTLLINDPRFSPAGVLAQKDTREAIDIVKLNAEIKGIVARQNELRTGIDEIVADLEGSR
ncbi:MAG: N-6 DNA methylase [Syntrophales bacterium]|jgi:type I restriction-modification system DNA methylase subunit|nr:N-6 DNA methylase [Syntrophales bacterium]